MHISKRIELARTLANQGLARKYTKFRLHSHWYDYLPTADTCFCFLQCQMCWSMNSSQNWEWGEKHGEFLSPQEVAGILGKFPRVRISGGEPSINPEHLLALASLLKNTRLLIETNGLGLTEDLILAFSELKNVYFRLSLKGVDDRSTEITCGEPIFTQQMEIARLLSKYKCPFHCALLNVYEPGHIAQVERNLKGIAPTPVSFFKDTSRVSALELEKLSLYPFNRHRVGKWLESLKVEGYA